MSTLLYRVVIWKLKHMLLKSAFDFSLIFIWKTSWLSFDRFRDFLLENDEPPLHSSKAAPLFRKHQWSQFSQSNNVILLQSFYTSWMWLLFTLSKFLLLLFRPVTFITKITLPVNHACISTNDHNFLQQTCLLTNVKGLWRSTHSLKEKDSMENPSDKWWICVQNIPPSQTDYWGLLKVQWEAQRSLVIVHNTIWFIVGLSASNAIHSTHQTTIGD